MRKTLTTLSMPVKIPKLTSSGLNSTMVMHDASFRTLLRNFEILSCNWVFVIFDGPKSSHKKSIPTEFLKNEKGIKKTSFRK